MGLLIILCHCCFVVAVIEDEKSRRVHRIVSLIACLCAGAVACYRIKYWLILGSLITDDAGLKKDTSLFFTEGMGAVSWVLTFCVPAGLLLVLSLFVRARQLGMADLFLCAAMFLLLLEPVKWQMQLFWDTLFLTIAFAGAAIRMTAEKGIRHKKEKRNHFKKAENPKKGCPFIGHLFGAFLVLEIGRMLLY